MSKPSRTAADLREMFQLLLTEWRDEGVNTSGFALVKVSGTARYDHWAIHHRPTPDSLATPVPGFEDMGSIAASFAVLKAAMLALRMTRRTSLWRTEF